MRHSNFKDKNSVATVINTADGEISAWKFTITSGLEAIEVGEIVTVGNYYKCDIQLPDEDCYVMARWGMVEEVIRVGYPAPIVLFHAEIDTVYEYKQLDLYGSELDSGDMTEIGEGYYYHEPTNIELGWYDINNGWITTFNVPYAEVTGGGGSGTIILQPNRFQMVAIPVRGVKVKEYFLDKVATAVGAEASTVIEFVKAFPSSDVSNNKYMVFVPGLTNIDSSTNFELVQTDGNIEEIVAFFVKTKVFDGTIEISWDSADGI